MKKAKAYSVFDRIIVFLRKFFEYFFKKEMRIYQAHDLKKNEDSRNKSLQMEKDFKNVKYDNKESDTEEVKENMKYTYEINQINSYDRNKSERIKDGKQYYKQEVQGSINKKAMPKTQTWFKNSNNSRRKKEQVKLQPKTIQEAILLFPEYINRSTREISVEELRYFVQNKMNKKIQTYKIEKELIDIANFNDDFTKFVFIFKNNEKELGYVQKILEKKKNGKELTGFEEDYLREYIADNYTIICWSCAYNNRCFNAEKKVCGNYKKEEMSATKYRMKVTTKH